MNEVASRDVVVREWAKRGQEHKSGSSSRGAFTRYVGALDSWDEPTNETFNEMWQALRAALTFELQRRSLWTSPPSYLGVYGWESWRQQSGHTGCTASALDELLVDCYSFIFLKRLARLKAQLEVKPEIEGLVFLYLRNYLHDRRKHYDPLGFRVFEVLRVAVRGAVAAGELHVLSGDSKILNQTILAFDAGDNPRVAFEQSHLGAIVERWNDDLLPDLVNAPRASRRRLIERLRRHLLDLEASGVRVFRFKDIIDPLKQDARARWAAIFELDGGACTSPGGEPAAVAHRIQPDCRLEEVESFMEFTGSIADRLELLDVPKKTHRYLRRLWCFLRTFAGDERMDRLPSNRKLSSLLGIPRDRLPGLYEILRQAIGDPAGAISARISA